MTFVVITAVQKFRRSKAYISKHRTVNKGVAIEVTPSQYKKIKEIKRNEKEIS